MKKKFLTDGRIELLIRFWSAGAVYLFIGWGTGLGQGSFIDFILVLGIVMAVFEMLAVNPLLRRMLKLKTGAGYLDTSILQKVAKRLGYVFKTILIMTIVAILYMLMNQIAVTLFQLSQDTVAVPGEPILFGLFYTIVFKLLEAIGQNIKRKTGDVKE